MEITNKFGLPQQFVEAAKADNYDKGGSDYSASELINPPQMVILKQRHKDEIKVDASDLVWRLMGKAAHKAMEDATTDKKNAIKELRIHKTMLDRGISGQIDLYDEDEHRLSDWKITSVWVAMNGYREEWMSQMNIYKYLLEENGLKVSIIEIVAIYRDWSLGESKRFGEKYPAKVEKVNMEIWSQEKAKAFIEMRLFSLVKAEELTDAELPECTSDERWAKPEAWAVTKKGAKKATKLETTVESAQMVVDAQKKPSDYEIQHRPGEWTRCEFYCDVKNFCKQFAKYRATKNSGEKEAQDEF